MAQSIGWLQVTDGNIARAGGSYSGDNGRIPARKNRHHMESGLLNFLPSLRLFFWGIFAIKQPEKNYSAQAQHCPIPWLRHLNPQ
jgi:hypothetical protein